MANKIHNFNKSLEIGDEGEAAVLAYLNQGSNIESIKDVTADPEYQQKDIDLMVKLKNGDEIAVEIKSDQYTSGNIYYEAVSNCEHNVPGCMVKSQANSLLYYFTETKELYLINFDAYKKWFEANKDRFRMVTIKNRTRKGDGISHSKGYLIPKKTLEEEFDGFNKVNTETKERLIVKVEKPKLNKKSGKEEIGDDGI